MHAKMFLQEHRAASPISRLSAVNSGWSPIMHAGKSNMGILNNQHNINKVIFHYCDKAYAFFAPIYAMIFWLKNFNTKGIQFAKTKCCDMNSN